MKRVYNFIYFKDYYEKKDKEDYFNVHKMYLDLDNIEKEFYQEEKEPNQKNEINKSDSNYSLKDIKSFVNFYNNFFIKQDQTEEEEANEIYEFDQSDINYEYMNGESEISILETLMKELEEKLGLKLFKDTYDLIQENVC